jgi:peptidoglycan/xylan/chitin deacetylase (PgdA/CDA1 family)
VIVRRLATRAAHWAAWRSGRTLRRIRRAGTARVLMLHAVGPGALPVAALERHLAWLRSGFDLVPLASIVEALESGRAFTGSEVALTFDDGLRCHAEVVAPLLAAHDVPATFFVCPGLVESGAWLWNQEARARLAGLDAGARTRWAARAGEPALGPEVEAAVAWLKTLASGRRDAALAALREATPAFERAAQDEAVNGPMSAEALRALDPARVAVGSHTLSHPILPTLDDATLEREVAEGRRRLEALTGRSADLFCYPNGAQDERVRACVGRHHRAAVTTEPGVVRAGTDPLRIPRVGVEDRVATSAWRMSRP